MTVETTNSVAIFIGDGAADTFDYAFRVISAEHLVVERLEAATGVLDKTLTAGEYTVAGIGTAAGSVTLTAGALSSDYHLRVRRVVPYTQTADIVVQGGFYPDVIEDQLDKTTMGLQQLAEETERSFQVPFGEAPGEVPPAADRAGKFLAFDANGDPIASLGDGSDGALRAELADDSGSTLVKHDPAGPLNFPLYAQALSDIINGQPISAWQLFSHAEQAAIAARTSDTDHTAAVQELMSDMFDKALGGVIELPIGTLNMNLEAVSGIVLRGHGRMGNFDLAESLNTVINATTADYIIDSPAAGSGTTSLESFTLENLTFTDGQGVGGVSGVRIRSARNVVLRRSLFKNLDGPAIYQDKPTGGKRNGTMLIDHVLVYDCLLDDSAFAANTYSVYLGGNDGRLCLLEQSGSQSAISTSGYRGGIKIDGADWVDLGGNIAQFNDVNWEINNYRHMLPYLKSDMAFKQSFLLGCVGSTVGGLIKRGGQGCVTGFTDALWNGVEAAANTERNKFDFHFERGPDWDSGTGGLDGAGDPFHLLRCVYDASNTTYADNKNDWTGCTATRDATLTTAAGKTRWVNVNSNGGGIMPQDAAVEGVGAFFTGTELLANGLGVANVSAAGKTITTIAGGNPGQVLELRFDYDTAVTADTTSTDDTKKVVLKGNTDFTFPAGSALTLRYHKGRWKEIGRSVKVATPTLTDPTDLPTALTAIAALNDLLQARGDAL